MQFRNWTAINSFVPRLLQHDGAWIVVTNKTRIDLCFLEWIIIASLQQVPSAEGIELWVS
jgi:hypothetical protein